MIQIADDPTIIQPILEQLKLTFQTNKTKSVSFRKQ